MPDPDASAWPHAPPLEDGVVHAWWSPVPERVTPAHARILTDAERARVTRYRHDADQRRFTHARALLRVLLAAYSGAPPAALTFTRACRLCERGGEHGKPRLAAPPADADVRFNVSHAGDVVLLAVTRGREVGVDVERVDQEWDDVAATAFHAAERARARDAPSTAAAFAAYWARKEALLKMEGVGLAAPLTDLDVSVLPADGIGTWRGRAVTVREWTPVPGHVASVVVDAADADVRVARAPHVIA